MHYPGDKKRGISGGKQVKIKKQRHSKSQIAETPAEERGAVVSFLYKYAEKAKARNTPVINKRISGNKKWVPVIPV